MDPVTAVVIGVAFAAWLAWRAYDHSEEWVKTARRWRKQMTGDGYATWARKHDGESAEVLLSAVATMSWQVTRAARAARSFAGRRAARPDPAPSAGTGGRERAGDADSAEPGTRRDEQPDHRDPAPEPAAPEPAEAPREGPGPDPAHEPVPAPPSQPAPVPNPAPHGAPMTVTNHPKRGGEIVGLRAVLAGWNRLITSGDNDREQAVQAAASMRKLADSSEAHCQQINATLTNLGQLEAACYAHSLEPAALAHVHQAMVAANAALNAQRRAHNDIAAAASSLRTAASAHAAAVAAYRAALTYLNRTHRPKAEVEASTGARSDRNFSTS
ncbi:hypothetical protein [Actinomadura sp. 3N508]|uniref:hypothetical protein n=1 Tax=Actinomadura sp. 3N508 TaxID=3375153 RepID=UPI00379E7821